MMTVFGVSCVYNTTPGLRDRGGEAQEATEYPEESSHQSYHHRKDRNLQLAFPVNFSGEVSNIRV
jgi:hypothetical protein